MSISARNQAWANGKCAEIKAICARILCRPRPELVQSAFDDRADGEHRRDHHVVIGHLRRPVRWPTAVGKTDLAIKLAQKFDTEIISADSRQIFRELSIGTAKPNQQELSAAVHHFINTHSIIDNYDAAQFGIEALAMVHQLFSSHDFVIVCGGSGLYVKALLEGFDET